MRIKASSLVSLVIEYRAESRVAVSISFHRFYQLCPDQRSMEDGADKTPPPVPPFTRDMLKSLLWEVIREESETKGGTEKPGDSSKSGKYKLFGSLLSFD